MAFGLRDDASKGAVGVLDRLEFSASPPGRWGRRGCERFPCHLGEGVAAQRAG